ncbi:hypothetical protein HDU76_002471, partial [Blyttiomyces sp. JEL0837]
SQNCIHWLDFLTKHNYNIAANAPDNCILLATTSKMINWNLDNGIQPKTHDQVIQLVNTAIENRFDTSLTRLINLGLISPLQVFDLIIDEFLSTIHPHWLEAYCAAIQALANMGRLQSVLKERQEYEMKMLLKCVEMGKSQLESNQYICLERILSAGVGKLQTPPLGNFKSDSTLFVRHQTAVSTCVNNHLPNATISFFNTPGYHPSLETARLVLEVSLEREEPMLDVFDHFVKLVMESEKSDADIIYEQVCNTYIDDYQSYFQDSKLVEVIKILANRGYKKVAPRELVDIVSKVSFLSLIVEKSKSPGSVFFWMFDVQLISETIPEMDMNILLTRLLEKKLFNVNFNGFVARNINTFAVFPNVLRDWFRKNTGVENTDESNAGIESVKWMVQNGLLELTVDEESGGKVLSAVIEIGNVFAAKLLFAIGHGKKDDLLEIWKVIRVQGFLSKRGAIKELLDQLLPGGWDSGYESISVVGKNNHFAGVTEDTKSKGRRPQLKKDVLQSVYGLSI